MKIQYCSDLHLEFRENDQLMAKNQLKPTGEVLVLAGDITYLDPKSYQHAFFDYISDHFEQVFMIPGNHEFYGGTDINLLNFPLEEKIRDNVKLLNNQVVKYKDVAFIFTALWAMISPRDSYLIEQSIADFKMIKSDGKRFSTVDFNQLHQRSFQFLERAAQQRQAEKTVVVTHHLPSGICNAEEFKGSILNQAFCVELGDFIHRSKADYWIYGHSHRNMSPQHINGTTLLTNQLGYVSLGEHHGFERDAFFEL